MKHIWWSTVLTIWLAIAGWVVLTITSHPGLATSIAHAGAAMACCCGALLAAGFFAGALDK